MSIHIPQILVVDEDPEIRKLLARYMREQGLRVQLAADTREAHTQLIANQIDLIVLDVMLPDSLGLDLCRDLRATRPDVPILLLTALKEDGDRIMSPEIGAADYLGKPFNPRELVARISAVLSRGRNAATNAATEAGATGGYHFDGFIADPFTRTLTGPDGGAAQLFDTVRNGGYQLAAEVSVWGRT